MDREDRRSMDVGTLVLDKPVGSFSQGTDQELKLSDARVWLEAHYFQ